MVNSTKELVTIPFFAVDRINEERTLNFNNEIWTITGPLTTEHSDILSGALTFSSPFKTAPVIKTDFNIFCRRIYGRSGENIRQKSIELLNDFKNTLIKIIHPDKPTRTFKIIDDFKATEHDITITLNQRYCDMLNDPNSRIVFSYNMMKQCHSKLAKAIQQYMPARASHATPENPQKISLNRLLQEVGHKPVKCKSIRYQRFINNKNSVMKQLDGARMMGNKIFKCRLEENSNRTDYNFLCWSVETKKHKQPKPTCKLYNAFEIGGGTWSQWCKLLKQEATTEFDMYEIEALEYFPNWQKSNNFLVMAKCLMGELFTECLGIIKNYVLEGKPISNSPMHMLNGKIMNYLKDGKFLKS